ncbi:MAG: HEAT repeat domain-containing protein [Pirellulales bacterium]
MGAHALQSLTHVAAAAKFARGRSVLYLALCIAALAFWQAQAAAQQADDPFAAPAADPAAAPAADAPAADAPADPGAMEEPAADAPAADDPAMDAPVGDAADVFDAADPDADPAAADAPAAGRPKPADAAEEEAQPAAPTDPAVLAILDWKPKTPVDLLRAIKILADLEHAALARPFVDDLSKQALDPAAKTALVDAFSPADLLKLARDKELGPVLGPMIDDWQQAAEEYRRDSARLTEAAKQLSDPSEATREQAAVQLLRARESAVAPLVAILADPERAAEQAAARQLLVYLGGLAVEPLLGVLESPDEALKIQVIDLLGRMNAYEAVPQLLAPLASPTSSAHMRSAAREALARILGHAPDGQQAVQMLERAARKPLDASRNADPLTAAPAIVWHWNREQNQSVPVEYDQTGAALAHATRLARELYLIDPNRGDWLRLYLTAMLQAAQVRRGLGHPLSTGPQSAYSAAAYYGPDVIDNVLAFAIAEGFVPAAIAATQVLGDVGNASLLLRGQPQPSPLARAAASADLRLRFSAVKAIMKLAPTQAFAGSSQVGDALGFFARSFGTPRVLVAHPNSAAAQTIAGLAAALGYETDIATNPRQAFELAVRSPDFDFVLAHSALNDPGLDFLVAQLRRDPRTARLPIGMLAPPDDLERVTLFAEQTPLAEAFLQPPNEAEMRVRANQLLARGGRWHVPANERQEQAVAALDWLAALAASPQRVFDIYREEPAVTSALYVPELTTHASAVLGDIGTASAQRSLIKLADLGTQPLDAREAAAAALARNIGQFGLRLTGDEVMQQYDLYNSNAGRNGDTHTVLTAVLDAIEQKPTPAGAP